MLLCGCVLCWHSQFETATSTEVGDPPGCQPINPTRGCGHVKVNQTFIARCREAASRCPFVFLAGQTCVATLWPCCLGALHLGGGGFSLFTLAAQVDWVPGRFQLSQGTVAVWRYSAVLSNKERGDQNDSKFPDASLTLAKNPTPNFVAPSPFFPPSHSSLPLPLYQPRPLRLPRRPRSIQPHPPANQSLTLNGPFTSRLSPPVRAKAVNDIRTNTTTSCSSTGPDQFIHQSTTCRRIACPRANPFNQHQKSNPFPIEIPHGGISQWRP